MAKAKSIYLENDIKTLDLDNSVINTLNSSNISTIGDLWIMNRKKLKEIGLKDSDIKSITIKLQLLGLDLNKKVYN